MTSCISRMQQFLNATQSTITESYNIVDVQYRRCTGSSIEETALQVQDIALFAIQILAASVLFLSNSSLFVLGAVIAVINKGVIDHSISKIVDVWEKLSPPKKALIITASIFAWPISLASAAFFVGGHLTSQLQDS